MRIPFTPIRRIIFGFGLCVLQMVICAVLQWRSVPPLFCGAWGHSAEGTDPSSFTASTRRRPAATTLLSALMTKAMLASQRTSIVSWSVIASNRHLTYVSIPLPRSLSIWTQIPLYVLPALAEVFINITSYEIVSSFPTASTLASRAQNAHQPVLFFALAQAITRAPQRMKGLVFAICLSMRSVYSMCVVAKVRLLTFLASPTQLAVVRLGAHYHSRVQGPAPALDPRRRCCRQRHRHGLHLDLLPPHG